MKQIPSMVLANARGEIYDEPKLKMLCDRNGEWRLPDPGDLMPLPRESDLFLLPGRKAAGYNQGTGKIEIADGLPVAAFPSPGYTLSAHPAYREDPEAQTLPLFAYGAVGYANGRFWICAKKVDDDPRQVFKNISQRSIESHAKRLARKYPRNRLLAHIINNCVFRYSCPAARNFALGRYEAPLPTSQSCNAHCVGCISAVQKDVPFQLTPQCRLDFTPSPEEIVEIMSIHAAREKAKPIFSFGQGCEGDPLLNAALLEESIRAYRQKGGKGTINCNTNASLPEAVNRLARAGLTSMRVSLNSARDDMYAAYYRGAYKFEAVRDSIKIARRGGVYVSLNLLYFPGITDTFTELEALADLCASCGVSMIQWRNLNIDPHWYQNYMSSEGSQAMGLAKFMSALKKKCPWLHYGYFNPWLEEKPIIDAPLP